MMAGKAMTTKGTKEMAAVAVAMKKHKRVN